MATGRDRMARGAAETDSALSPSLFFPVRRALAVNVEKKESQRLQEAATKHPGAKQRDMQEARRRLPAFSQRQEVLALLQRHRVLVISGATGAACLPLPPVVEFRV